jgi:xanthine dehydrogenase iron-sulfur cluster and FAD-binding subunit A
MASAVHAQCTSTPVNSVFASPRCMRARDHNPGGHRQPESLHFGSRVRCLRAYQCGYCTPGQVMSAVALLKEPCGPEDADVKEFMSGNICRCGAYPNIVAAIQSVRQKAKPAKTG